MQEIIASLIIFDNYTYYSCQNDRYILNLFRIHFEKKAFEFKLRLVDYMAKDERSTAKIKR